MQFVRTAARIVRLLRLWPPQPAALDIDLSTLAPSDTHIPAPEVSQFTVDQLTAPAGADGAQDWRTTNPWRTQPGVRYRL